mmetsp:Transcript_1754/g.6262  ORF Transcript_1754/g.6262 Transcript_1754/m.6262 type:complete len:82 (-) Transcript_1754:1197-1442(-)
MQSALSDTAGTTIWRKGIFQSFQRMGKSDSSNSAEQKEAETIGSTAVLSPEATRPPVNPPLPSTSRPASRSVRTSAQSAPA